jgi:hypothetical protein
MGSAIIKLGNKIWLNACSSREMFTDAHFYYQGHSSACHAAFGIMYIKTPIGST